MSHVVVVGGGFCGAAVALHLRRDHPGLDVAVTVVEPRERLGAGLAYGSGDPACRVNVAASRMSPFEETPDAFDAWLRGGGGDAADAAMADAGGLFPARAVYGRYVASLLEGRDVAHRRARAVSAARGASGFVVGLDDGGVLEADVLVLATGHGRPGLPAGLAGIARDERLVGDPWDEAALARVAAEVASPVLVVGTGLTACDVLASLRRRGHRGVVTAVSRRGLLPRPRTSLPVAPFGRFDEAPERRAGSLLRRVRRAVAEAASLGRPWEDVIASLREQAPVVWGALDEAARRRLLRHARAWWDVHRFQCAPQIARLVEAERASGRFRVLAGSVRQARPADGWLEVTATARGTGATVRLRNAWVVNCTGPGQAAAGLAGAMAAAGLVRADALGLGLETDAVNRAVSAGGVASEDLFVAGPPARAAHGELMGLPQVTRQPRAVAAAIAARLRPGRCPGPAGALAPDPILLNGF